MNGIRLTGTFLDEISHDIPHQNWGKAEWEHDFQAMKRMGIDTVILIRCGYQQWLTYPSALLQKQADGYLPPLDLVDLFLTLAEKYSMDFYFGTYDSGRFWTTGEYQREIDINLAVIDEVWQRYGDRAAFKGWYLSQEVSRRTRAITEIYARMGHHCKQLSPQLPVLISPWIDGVKSVSSFGSQIQKEQGITLAQHQAEWNEIMAAISGAVDIVAFQDGHVDYHQLPEFLAMNKQLAEANGLRCWTNSESFDRDMPIKFMPIKWEKLLLKLKAAEEVGIEKGITFEFSHFMSPNACYVQAHHLYRRYCQHFGLEQT